MVLDRNRTHSKAISGALLCRQHNSNGDLLTRIKRCQVVHFVTFCAPLWGAIIFNGFTYFQDFFVGLLGHMPNYLTLNSQMAVGMSDRAFNADSRTDMKALNRWGYYPLILIGSWFFGTINRIHDFIEPGHKIFWLSVLYVGMAALMGLFNSIAYGLNSSVRRAIHERLDLLPKRFKRWLPKIVKIRGQQEESELLSMKFRISKSDLNTLFGTLVLEREFCI